jgi:quercetin dioxygenase-like cupin family protein
MKYVSLSELSSQPTIHNAGKKKVMIKSGFINLLQQFAQVEFQPGEVTDEHMHPDMYEVYLVEKGEGKIYINGKEYALSPGVCITVEPGENHYVSNTEKNTLVLTYFELIKQASL